MRMVADKALLVEQGGQVTADFIPFDSMTFAEKIDHLRTAHAFREYEQDGEPQYFAGFDEDSLRVFHDEDHNSEHVYGGAVTCQHTHDKGGDRTGTATSGPLTGVA